MIVFTLTVFTVLFGMLMLWGRNLDFLGAFLCLGYLATFLNMARSIRCWRDWLNPLALILALCMIRFSLGAFLMPESGGPRLFDRIGLRATDWQLGHVLGLTGWSAFALGWLLVPGRWRKETQLADSVRLPVMVVAVVACAAGFFFLIRFVQLNGGSLDLVVTGAFRGMEVQSGTGLFNVLSFLLIAGSIVWSAYLFRNLSHRWLGFAPVAVAMLAFGVLGGRARAMSPLVAGLLLYWYIRRAEEGWGRMPTLRYIAALAAVPVGLWIANFGQLYRGLGVDAFTESIVTLREYAQYAVFLDVGGLASLAGSVSVEAGGLEGKTFFGLLWPLSQFLELPGRNAAVWMTEQLVGGFDDKKWGLNSSLMGDAYMNFGIAGVPVVMGMFGAFLKLVYAGFRTGRVHAAPYTVVVVWALQIFFASFNKWGQMNLVLMSLFGIFLAGSALPESRSASRLPSRLQAGEL